ncbi:MAG: VOC family protein, partial [Bacteroidota bacterium]|nr:VOC family protein [Bacteroidota bacterium]
DGGPAHAFGFTPGISLVVNCDTAEEIDHFWDNLTEGGDERAQQCGWLTDKYGVSWQVVPTALGTMLSDPDHKKSERVMQALIQMKKLDLNVLQKAYKQPD